MSIKFLYSKEARAAVDEINSKPISVLGMGGNSTRDIGKEGVQGLFSLTYVRGGTIITKDRKPAAEKKLHEVFDGKKGSVTVKEVLGILKDFDQTDVVQWKGIFTTVGRVIFNEVIFGHLKFRFINEDVTKGKLGDIMDELTDELVNQRVSMEDYTDALNKHEQLGFAITDVVSPGISYHMLMADDPVFNNKKEEVYNKYKKGIEEDKDPAAMEGYEQEMIEFSKTHYATDPMSDLYTSGVSPKWHVDWKTLKISLGTIPDPGTSNYRLVTSNLKEGMKTEDILAAANLQIFGAHARAADTALGGYMVTRLNALFQSLKGYNGDCGSTQYLEVIDDNPADLLYRYILVNGQEVLVTPDNIKQYFGKKVKKRSPIFCKGIKGGICSHCLGEKPFLLTKEKEVNIGMYVPNIGSTILNAYMKATHDMGVKLYKIEDLNDFVE